MKKEEVWVGEEIQRGERDYYIIRGTTKQDLLLLHHLHASLPLPFLITFSHFIARIQLPLNFSDDNSLRILLRAGH